MKDRGTITVLHGKGDRRRTVGVDPGAMAIIMRWVEARKQLGVDGRKPLFCTLQGKAVKPSYVRSMLVRVADKAGIEKRVHPHGLRHTHSFELMFEGVPVPIIQKQLGHASLATTDRYLQWEALSIDGHHRFLSYNDDSRWEQVWASFGFTNVESCTSGYWSHTVGLVASGIAAIARDEYMERRAVELLHVDDTSPEDVVHLIWSVESNFSELRFPEELTQAYKDGNPLDSFQTEGGFEWHLTLSVSEEVLSLL